MKQSTVDETSLDPRWFDTSCGKYANAEAYHEHMARSSSSVDEEAISAEEEEDAGTSPLDSMSPYDAMIANSLFKHMNRLCRAVSGHEDDMLHFNGITCKRSELEYLLGALTESVRNDWRDADHRVSLIRDICVFLKEPAWEADVADFYECSDGRQFRDTQSGIPYGNRMSRGHPFYSKYHAIVCFDCRSGDEADCLAGTE